ncbi:MAG TPA: hypothetical protein VJ521_08930, partial [Acidobacteriota bacterium]|nr:hypothetical protein [Acidobacteriota bacterium]
FFCGSYYYGQIWEDIGDSVAESDGKVSSEIILKLTPSARDTVFEMIENTWQKLEEMEDLE